MDQLPKGGFAALVPEFSVTNIDVSKRFWCDLLGFEVAYERIEKRFAYLEMQGAQVMLDEREGVWETGVFEKPLGRGVNFQIFVSDVAPILSALETAEWPLFRAVHDAWYRTADQESGNRQFLVQDPDGYLLRFAQDIGLRPLTKVDT